MDGDTANAALCTSYARLGPGSVERGTARLKSCQIFRRARISPHRITVIAKAVLTLERVMARRLTDYTRKVGLPTRTRHSGAE